MSFDISWEFLCQHRDIFSWTSAMWADQLALSLGQLLLSERLSWQKCFASTSQSGGDIDEAQIGQKQLMAQSSDAFSCLVRFCTLDVFLDAFQTNLVTIEPLSHVLKSSIKKEGLMWKACHLRFHFVAASSEEWWMGVCAAQLRMPLKYLPIRPSIKCSLGRCKLKDQTIFLREASTKRTTWFKIAQYWECPKNVDLQKKIITKIGCGGHKCSHENEFAALDPAFSQSLSEKQPKSTFPDTGGAGYWWFSLCKCAPWFQQHSISHFFGHPVCLDETLKDVAMAFTDWNWMVPNCCIIFRKHL